MSLSVFFNIVSVLAFLTFSLPAQAQQSTLEGVLAVAYEDREDAHRVLYQLYTLDGMTIPLDISPEVLAEAGGVMALSGARVRVTLDTMPDRLNTNDGAVVLAISSLDAVPGRDSAGRTAVLGAQTWANLLCKFGGEAAEPFTSAEVTGIFTNSYPRIDHYWREASYNQISIASVTTTAWKTLPQTRTYYLGLGGWAMLDKLFDDCAALHTSTITFSTYYGVNLFFNNGLDGSYHGGPCVFRSLQGSPARCFPTTWMPFYNTLYNIGAYAHEMGHAYALPHTDNSDGDGNIYDSFYDAISAPMCGVEVPPYICVPPHIHAYHKWTLGWIPPARLFTLSTNGTFPVTLDRLAKPTSTNYYAVTVPINATRSVFAEARRNDFNDYDKLLGNSGVIFYDINTGRPEVPWQLNAMTDGSSYEGPGVFQVGETLKDFVNGFSMTVNSQTADGFATTWFKGSLGSAPDLVTTIQSSTVSTGRANVTVRVRNNGSGTATNAFLGIDPPSSVYLNVITATPGCYQSAAPYTNSYLCSLGNLAPGAQVDIPLDLRPATTMTIPLSPVAMSNELETTSANNRTTTTTASVTALPDMHIQMSQSAPSVAVNENVTYTYLLRNVGGANGQTVQFAAPLPTGMTLQSWSWYIIGNMDAPVCTPSAQGVNCTFASLGPNYQWNTHLLLTIIARSSTAGEKTISSTVTVNGADATPADNTASVTTRVGFRTVNATPVYQGRPTAPNTLLSMPLSVRVTPSAGGSPVFDGTLTTDNNGRFTLELLPGTYNVRVKGSHTLSTVTSVTVTTGTNNFTLGTLREGDANNDNTVSLSDFSLLASSFGRATGEAGFDARADFNGDGIVQLNDFSLLASNYSQSGQ